MTPPDTEDIPSSGLLVDESEPPSAPLRTDSTPHNLTPATLAIHADNHLNTHTAVAPPLHTSTTFRYPSHPDDLAPWPNTANTANTANPDHIYSRISAPNTTRLEAVLGAVLGGPAVTYASGLAAFHALLVRVNPRRVALGAGYHGCHGVVALVARLTGLEALALGDGDAAADAAALARLRPGDLVHVETPRNPAGEARDVARYARAARARGCVLSVDATLAPPPLLAPFRWGADVVLHSGTKYLGGHSDMLCGVLAVAPRVEAERGWARALREERLLLGSVMGSLEGWLGVRSLRTLELRVLRQSESAGRLVAWLDGERKRQDKEEEGERGRSSSSVVGRMVERVQHASLQPEAREEGSWLQQQMPRGYGPVFSIVMREADDARRLPSKLRLFQHATSLGGVESLIEWRAISDKSIAKTVLRVSVGVEGWEDLREDLEQGFRALWEEREEGVGGV